MNENGTLCEVVQLIAQSTKAHKMVEELILLTAVIICKKIIIVSAAKLVSSVS